MKFKDAATAQVYDKNVCALTSINWTAACSQPKLDLQSFLVVARDCLRVEPVPAAAGLVCWLDAVTSWYDEAWSRDANIATRGNVPTPLKQQQWHQLTAPRLDQFDQCMMCAPNME